MVSEVPQRPWWGLGDVAAGIVLAQVVSLVVAVLVFGIAGWEDPAEAPLWATALLQVPLWSALAGVAIWVSLDKGFGPVKDYGLTMRALDAPVGLVVGIASQLLVLPLLYWPLLPLLGSSSEELSEPAEALADRAEGTVGWILLVLIVVVAAPVIEELFYRGLFLRALTKRGFPNWVAVLGTALVFGSMHFQLLQFPGLFVFGVILALLTVYTGRLGPAIWAHVGFNGTTVVSLYLQAH